MKSFAFFSSLFFSFLVLSLVSCGGDNNQTSGDDSSDMMDDTATASSINLSDFSASPPYSDAGLQFKGFKNGTFSFDVSNYQLGAQTEDAPQKMCANSKDGQHIHLIVDDSPYAAKYTADFEYKVEDGSHYVLAFLSRSYHESIKTNPAHVVFKGNFEGGNLTSQEPVSDPMLFYSRPKGTYVGKSETDKIMLDFYLVNTTLAADGNKVKVNVNGEKEFVVDTWKPYFLEGLPMGDNKITLTLIDKDGNAVAAPLNPVERVFTLKEDPAE